MKRGKKGRNRRRFGMGAPFSKRSFGKGEYRKAKM